MVGRVTSIRLQHGLYFYFATGMSLVWKFATIATVVLFKRWESRSNIHPQVGKIYYLVEYYPCTQTIQNIDCNCELAFYHI
jgi:hypothetical protein